MPVDFSLLMGPSPPAYHNHTYDFRQLPSFDPEIARAGLPWRRVSSYPLANGTELCGTKPTSFKLASRSYSEMALPEAVEACVRVSEPESLSVSAPSATLSLAALKEELTKLREEEEAAVVAEIKANKKRVWFADEEGEAACEEARPSATWKLNFAQPASEYLKFRQTMERQNVALENVILRNEACTLNGTIKVRNLCFRKEVFIRLTDDGWASYKDFPALFSPGAGNGSAEAWETFSFHLQIPCDDDRRQKLAFCVCFRAEDGTEYWDSKGGANFEVVSQKTSTPYPPFQPTLDPFSLPATHNLAHFSVFRDLADVNPYY